jgi:hypothetical protein
MRFDPPPGALESFNKRRERKKRNQRIAALAIGVIVAAVVLGGLARVILRSEPTPAAPPSIFDQVHGWIAVGTTSGVVAIDPEAPTQRVPLTSVLGIPVAWSRDGSQLLLETGRTLSVLRSDGALIAVPHTRDASGIGFTPDGSEVVFDRRAEAYAADPATRRVRAFVAMPSKKDGLYVDPFSGGELSPDGRTLVAVPTGFAPPGVHGWNISLLDAASGSLQLLVSQEQATRLHRAPDFQGLVPGAWSPDGTRIAFTTEGKFHCVLAVVNRDGSGLRPLMPPSQCTLGPTWSPDGSEIAGTNEMTELRIMNADGSDVRTVHFQRGTSGGPMLFAAWNPLPET